MFLIISIDAEEDNWGDYTRSVQTIENIKKIKFLQDSFDQFAVKPTYLITYPVATNKEAVSTLRNILDQGKCEIGAHCHPWNTPPFEEEITARNSMLCNLPPDLQYRKMECLHGVIMQNFGIKPISFRAGRWGYSQEVAKNLYRLGYRIDTSVTPFVDWRDYHGPDCPDILPSPFKFTCENAHKKTPDGVMFEVPATIGFLQNNFLRSGYLLKTFGNKSLRNLRLKGIMYRLNLLNKVWLSPELSDVKSMIKLTRVMMRNDYRFLNMTFHSASLKCGLSPFVKTEQDEREIINRIKGYLAFVCDSGIESIKLADVMNHV